MKIIDKRNEVEKKTFGDLKHGEVFCRHDKGPVYMKVMNLYEFNFVTANAICLNDGKTAYYGDDAKVIPLNCECIITNK